MNLANIKTVEELAAKVKTLIATTYDVPTYTDARLTADVAVSGTSITVSRLPTGVIADGFYVVIDPWTTECEVRKVTGLSGLDLTVTALTYAHSADDAVIYTTDPTLNVKWFGATTASAATTVTAFTRAFTNVTELGGAHLIIPEFYTINDFIPLVSNVHITGLGKHTGIDGDGITQDLTKGFFYSDKMSDIYIENMTFAGDGENVHINLEASDNLKIINNWFIDDAGGTSNVAAVRVRYSDSGVAEDSLNIEIGGNYFEVTSNAVLLQGKQTGPSEIKYVNIRDNIISGAVGNTTYTHGVLKVDIQCKFVEIVNNIIYGESNIQRAINVQEDSYNVIVANNVIFDCILTGIHIESGQADKTVQRVSVTDNMITTVDGGSGSGISLDPTTATFQDFLIADNLIRNCDYGIRENTDGVTDLVIQGNHIMDCATYEGIYVRSDDVIVKDNNVNGSTSAASLYINATADGTIVRGNIFNQVSAGGNYIGDNGTNTLRVHNILGGDPDLNWEDWVDYSATSTITGWSSYTYKEIYYTKLPNGIAKIQYRLVGTSNSTTTSFTLPFNADNSMTIIAHRPGVAKDSGSPLNGAAHGLINTATPGTVSFYTNDNSSAWTASGTKVVAGEFFYMTA